MELVSRDVKLDDGTALHVREHAGSTAPLVFLHDLDCSSEYWTPVLQRLLELDPELHLLAVDLRGHGASTCAGETSRKRLVNDIRRLCKQLEFDEPTLCGHGWGADIALASDHVGSVIAVNPAFGRSPAPFPEEVERPPGMAGAISPTVLSALTVGATTAKRLRRSRRDAPLLLLAADPLDTASEWYPEIADAALEHFAWQDATRHLPREMPAAVAALVLAWMQEVA